MDKPIETPRTDSLCMKAWNEDGVQMREYVVPAIFACELEREVIRLSAIRDDFLRIVDRLNAELRQAGGHRILGFDQGRPGGDYTAFFCSCGKVRFDHDGPCGRSICPIPTIASTSTKSATK